MCVCHDSHVDASGQFAAVGSLSAMPALWIKLLDDQS